MFHDTIECFVSVETQATILTGKKQMRLFCGFFLAFFSHCFQFFSRFIGCQVYCQTDGSPSSQGGQINHKCFYNGKGTVSNRRANVFVPSFLNVVTRRSPEGFGWFKLGQDTGSGSSSRSDLESMLFRPTLIMDSAISSAISAVERFSRSDFVKIS